MMVILEIFHLSHCSPREPRETALTIRIRGVLSHLRLNFINRVKLTFKLIDVEGPLVQGLEGMNLGLSARAGRCLADLRRFLLLLEW